MKLFNNLFRQPYLNPEDDFGGGDGFDDVTPDNDDMSDDIDDTPAEQSKEEPKEELDTKPEEPKESPKVKLKYNHEEKEYSLEDVVPLAQKGLNYDKLQEKFNAIQNDPALSKYSKVKEVSELLGYQTDDELLDALYDTYYQRTAETKGLTPEQIRKEHELTQKEKNIQQKVTELSQKEKDNEMYTKFLNTFPDVKAEMISQETWEKVAKGMDLITAYTIQQNKELQEQLKTLKQNSENLKKAPVGGVSKHGADRPQAKDAFLEGFDED